MPADESLCQKPSAVHGNGDAPYPCHKAEAAPGASWAIEYGYCRHSLDQLAGRDDKRCPTDCKHKAPLEVSDRFIEIFLNKDGGAMKAAKYSREQRYGADEERVSAGAD